MCEYIEDVFGCKALKLPCEDYSFLPLYLRNEYNYERYAICEQNCIFATPKDFDFVKYKKHKEKLQQALNANIILSCGTLTQYQRNALVRENIPFVVENNQVYLPFLATYLTEQYNRKHTMPDRFTAITQLVFLYIFYNKTMLTATELAKRLNLTVMSVNRAYNVLIDSNLFDSKTVGRKKYIEPSKTGLKLLESAEEFMFNPVEKVWFTDQTPDDLKASGLTALSDKTNLAADGSYVCYAASRDYIKNHKDSLDKESGRIRIEQWAYDPSLLSQADSVDDISLLMALSEEKDERVLSEMNKIKGKYTNDKWH